MRTIALLTLLLLVLSGCGLAYRVLLGIDTTPKWYSKEKVIKAFDDYEIPKEERFILDTASYKNAVIKHFKQNAKEYAKDSARWKTMKKVANDDLQSVQFRMFSKEGKEVFKIVNCYIDPPIPMNWNVENCFASVPPKTSIKTLNIHHFDIPFILQHITTSKGEEVSFSDYPGYDYYGLIFWNSFYIKPSRKLIATVREYTNVNELNMKLFYINNHNASVWSLLDDKTKNELKTQLKEN